ncbi:protein translocase subunit SecD [Spirulina subsalsa FACHB-351]|uniref:Protein translocase subunit SecD n=1 Tax=Spirulina subsalsa FACHB-351 TaxID=234711 RepID=A0ABT3L564_9CYAN|nr:protein translocase subunit SecD [Spirulina subsalsa]MCW6036130.1 protein translocase subunit SecD [Spirulina subsalsa FACHB-351]
MQKQRLTIAFILALVAAAIAILILMPLNLGLDLKGGARLTLQVQPTAEFPDVTTENLADVKRVLENRVNGLGVAEPIIQTVNPDKIVVQLPGVSNPEQAEKVLQGTAQLEFKSQKRGTETELIPQLNLRDLAEAELEALRSENASPEDIAAAQEQVDLANQALAELFESTDLTGQYLRDARAGTIGTSDRWQVNIVFDGEGGNKFAELTKSVAGTGRGLGIFLDDVLISAPTVSIEYAETGITGGRAQITGNFTLQEANGLAIQLRGGALPFPVEIVENRTVGATLGRDSVNRSVVAGLSGLALVLVYMVVYYRLPGAIADLALIIYALLTLGCYALVGVTLTLPGIAGFILSIGMAVDANVLIFERTREELRAGKTLYRSVESGFYRAFSSILDSNVTTLIACAALFWLGSGLVKGFALTLAIGVLVSMFTALTCSRTFMLAIVLGMPGVRQKPELFCPNLRTQA